MRATVVCGAQEVGGLPPLRGPTWQTGTTKADTPSSGVRTIYFLDQEAGTVTRSMPTSSSSSSITSSRSSNSRFARTQAGFNAWRRGCTLLKQRTEIATTLRRSKNQIISGGARRILVASNGGDR